MPPAPSTIADPGRPHSLLQHQRENHAAIGAERLPDAELAQPLRHTEREHPVDADGRQHAAPRRRRARAAASATAGPRATAPPTDPSSARRRSAARDRSTARRRAPAAPVRRGSRLVFSDRAPCRPRLLRDRIVDALLLHRLAEIDAVDRADDADDRERRDSSARRAESAGRCGSDPSRNTASPGTDRSPRPAACRPRRRR